MAPGRLPIDRRAATRQASPVGNGRNAGAAMPKGVELRRAMEHRPRDRFGDPLNSRTADDGSWRVPGAFFVSGRRE